MKLVPVSFDGLALNSTSFTAIFPAGNNNAWSQAAPDPRYIQRLNSIPKLAGVFGRERYIPVAIHIKGDEDAINPRRDTLAGTLDASDNSGTEKTLIAKDTANSDKQWQVEGILAGFDWNSPKVVATIAVADSRWRSVTQNSTTWSNPAHAGTLSITPGGNIETLPTIEVTPTGARTGSGQLYKRFVRVTNPSTRPLGERAWNLANSEAANGLDTGALVSTGKMLASGNDLHVIVDGQSVNRWLQDMNTTSTEIWTRLNLDAGITLTLGVAIADSGDITEIEMEDTLANEDSLRDLPSTGQVLIDSEYFTYTGKNVSERKLTGVTRAVFGSSMGAHTVTDTVTWIQHQIFLLYGDSAAASPNTPDADDLKPMFRLDSENTRLDYDDFQTQAGSRANEWVNSITIRKPIGRTSMSGPDEMTLYTAVHNSTTNKPQWADPATHMGAAVQAVLDGSEYVRTAGDLYWTLHHPCGIKSVTLTGQKFAVETDDWLQGIKLLYSDDGENWTTKSTEAAPAADGTWESIDNTGAQAFGDEYKYVSLLMKGGQQGGATQHRALVEYSDVEVSLYSTNVPAVAIGSEIADQVELKANIQVNGETLFINNPVIDQNDTLVIDCENRDVYLKGDNTKLREFIDTDTIRSKWLRLLGGTSNTLTYNDTGLGNVSVVVKYYDRNN